MLQHENAVAEEAQRQVLADPTFGELADLLGGCAGSDSDASSEGGQSEEHHEEASPDSTESQALNYGSSEDLHSPSHNTSQTSTVLDSNLSDSSHIVMVTCPEG